MVDIFSERVARFENKLEATKQQSLKYSILRSVLFILLIGFTIAWFRLEYPFLIVSSLLSFAGFYFSVIKHRKIETEHMRLSDLIRINEDELKRSKLDLSGLESGNQFLKEDHPYQADLDIFGQHSIYQLINRCELEESKAMFANWLSQGANKEEIENRQAAARELSTKLDWRHDFQSSIRRSIVKRKKQDPLLSAANIVRWAKVIKPEIKSAAWKAVAIALTLFFIAVTLTIIFAQIPYQFIYVPLVSNAIALALMLPKLNQMSSGIGKANHLIMAYSEALKFITSENFQSTPLQNLQAQLAPDATKAISELARLAHRLGARSNMLYAVLDIPFLLDVFLAIAIFRWKTRYGKRVDQWLRIVNEYECLSSIAGFHFSNPNYSFPEIISQPFTFKAESLGHPLIDKKDKVFNDYQIEGQGKVDIITGSNMSGKSTFQRTIGINMVLAQCGCPVDARSLSMSLTQIFTSMRTKDNLEEHTSSFYAELRRISQLLQATEGNDSTFFILDEILKGTNSEDRHKGSVALINKLSLRQAFGLVSTHDLQLGHLTESNDHIRNFSFNSEIENRRIKFDYKLTEGVCKSFNASQLMENMGIL
jgi:hypothetical protein